MPYFRVDDGFHCHPKVLTAGNEAVGLYVRCGSYAAQQLTDGYIPEDIAMLYGSRELADALVRTRLWRRVRGGWRMPDYLDYNYSREQVLAERSNAAERQRRARERAAYNGKASRRDNAVSHGPPIQANKEPPNPPPRGGQPCPRHKRPRSGCAACAPSPQPPPIYALCGHGRDGTTCPFCRSEAV